MSGQKSLGFTTYPLQYLKYFRDDIQRNCTINASDSLLFNCPQEYLIYNSNDFIQNSFTSILPKGDTQNIIAVQKMVDPSEYNAIAYIKENKNSMISPSGSGSNLVERTLFNYQFSQQIKNFVYFYYSFDVQLAVFVFENDKIGIVQITYDKQQYTDRDISYLFQSPGSIIHIKGFQNYVSSNYQQYFVTVSFTNSYLLTQYQISQMDDGTYQFQQILQVTIGNDYVHSLTANNMYIALGIPSQNYAQNIASGNFQQIATGIPSQNSNQFGILNVYSSQDLSLVYQVQGNKDNQQLAQSIQIVRKILQPFNVEAHYIYFNSIFQRNLINQFQIGQILILPPTSTTQQLIQLTFQVYLSPQRQTNSYFSSFDIYGEKLFFKAQFDSYSEIVPICQSDQYFQNQGQGSTNSFCYQCPYDPTNLNQQSPVLSIFVQQNNCYSCSQFQQYISENLNIYNNLYCKYADQINPSQNNNQTQTSQQNSTTNQNSTSGQPFVSNQNSTSVAVNASTGSQNITSNTTVNNSTALSNNTPSINIPQNTTIQKQNGNNSQISINKQQTNSQNSTQIDQNQTLIDVNNSSAPSQTELNATSNSNSLIQSFESSSIIIIACSIAGLIIVVISILIYIKVCNKKYQQGQQSSKQIEEDKKKVLDTETPSKTEDTSDIQKDSNTQEVSKQDQFKYQSLQQKQDSPLQFNKNKINYQSINNTNNEIENQNNKFQGKFKLNLQFLDASQKDQQSQNKQMNSKENNLNGIQIDQKKQEGNNNKNQGDNEELEIKSLSINESSISFDFQDKNIENDLKRNSIHPPQIVPQAAHNKEIKIQDLKSEQDIKEESFSISGSFENSI